MKPDWKDAPEWASCLALDGDGSWWWYEEAPSWDAYACAWITDGRSIKAGEMVGPDETLEYRP